MHPLWPRAHSLTRCTRLQSTRSRSSRPLGMSSSPPHSSPSAIIATAAQSDVAWRPVVPVGHSAYTWHGAHHESTAHPPRAAKYFPPSPDVAAAASSSPAAPAAATASASSTAPSKQPKAPKAPKPAKQPKAAVAPASDAAASSSSSGPAVAGGRPSVLAHPAFSSVRLIDIGANLLDDMFLGSYHGKSRHPPDLDDVLERARARGVDRIIVTAGSAPESGQVLDLIAAAQARDPDGHRFPRLFSTVGVHPTRANTWDGSAAHQQAYFDQLMHAIERGMGHTPRTVVAIGECGLDYDRLHFSNKHSQNAHFEKHFDIVERVHAKFGVHLPLFLHDRNTGGDFAAVLRKNRARFHHGVVHSFTGTIDELKAHLALDLYIGINGCSLKTEANLAALHHIPLDRLLLETDAPWCDVKNTHASAPLVAPDSRLPVAGKPENFKSGTGVKGRNEPGNMIHVLEVVSSHLGVDPIELAAIVEANTNRVFFPNDEEKTKTEA